MSSASPYDTLTVREAMNRIGLILFPDQWTGKEYLDHWKLGLNPLPVTKLRGMEAVRELLKLVWEDRVTVEAETADGTYRPISHDDVRYFHGARSMVAGDDENYKPCRLRFPSIELGKATSKGGRKGYNYAPIVVRILTYLDEHGTSKSSDFITRHIRIEMAKAGMKPPSYSRLQPFVSELLAYRVTIAQHFPDSIPGTEPCD